jgi:hypothetical protein
VGEEEFAFRFIQSRNGAVSPLSAAAMVLPQ